MIQPLLDLFNDDEKLKFKACQQLSQGGSIAPSSLFHIHLKAAYLFMQRYNIKSPIVDLNSTYCIA
jgi:hypothetical protein